jgi:prephenate dehydrogenase
LAVFNKLVIIGVGLIGGSLGMALCNRRIAETVVGVGRDKEKLNAALKCGAIHQASLNPLQAVAEAEIVVLSAHLSANQELLRDISPHLTPGTVVTDVGSVKGEIVRTAQELMPEGVFFVGGHPMAGSEQQGIAGADPYLFENAYYILTPTPDLPVWALEKVKAMARGVGARVIELSPMEHDLAVAALSHLPHVIAYSLVNSLTLLPGGDKFLPLAAGGFRDTTRIALSNPGMWRDILMANQEMLTNVLGLFKQELQLLESAVLSNHKEDIDLFLQRAKEIRASIPAKTKGYLPVLFEILVTIPDHPGSIANVAGILAREGINIADIEILRVREGEGGSVRLGFAAEDEQDNAIFTLRAAGIQVVKRGG